MSANTLIFFISGLSSLMCLFVLIRERPFNFKGGGLWFFGRNQFSVCKFASKKNYVSEKWAEQNILLALCALNIIVFIEKNNVATTCREEKNSAALQSEKKCFDSEKNHGPPSPPPPLKLNGSSINTISCRRLGYIAAVLVDVQCEVTPLKLKGKGSSYKLKRLLNKRFNCERTVFDNG